LDGDKWILEQQLPHAQENGELFYKRGYVQLNKEVEFIEVDPKRMPEDLLKKGRQGAIKRYREKRTEKKPVDLKGRSRREAIVIRLIQEAEARHQAGHFAMACGYHPGIQWSVIWDTNGETWVIFTRPPEETFLDEDGCSVNDSPYVLKREDAIVVLDGLWDSFIHVGDVPGLTERDEHGSKLTWAAAPFWNDPSAAAGVTTTKTGGKSKNTRWLIDSGCGWDLVDKRNVTHLGNLMESISVGPKLWTANGVVQPDSQVPIFIPVLGTTYVPLVMQDSPDVLSLGRRCMEEGYGFHWEATNPHHPYLVTPSGCRVDLMVDHYCPYLEANSCAACPVSDPEDQGGSNSDPGISAGASSSTDKQDSHVPAEKDDDEDMELEKERIDGFKTKVDPVRVKNPGRSIDLDDPVELVEHDVLEPRQRRNTKKEASSLRHILLHDRKTSVVQSVMKWWCRVFLIVVAKIRGSMRSLGT